MTPEDLSLQRQFRYLEWAALILTAGAQFVWTCAVVKYDELIAVSYLLLLLIFVVAIYTPGTVQWRFIHLICQTLLIAAASALGAHHFVYLYLYLLAAKAALLLPRTQMITVAVLLAISHIFAGQFAQYALQHMHVHRHPVPAYYRSFILEGQAALYFIISLITVTFLGRLLLAERKSMSAEKRLAKEVEKSAVKLERARIARDIHDGLGSTLTNLRIRLELALKLFDEPEASSKVLPLLKLCQDAAGTALTDVRRALRAERDGDFNLKQAVTGLVRQVNQESDLKINVRFDDISLPLAVQHQIFSIIQECLTNVYKHSSADRVEIVLTQKNELASLAVRDNGKGFDLSVDNPGFGLQGLRERAQTIGATIKISSDLGEGTDILVSFPIAASNSEKLAGHDPSDKSGQSRRFEESQGQQASL